MKGVFEYFSRLLIYENGLDANGTQKISLRLHLKKTSREILMEQTFKTSNCL